MLSSRMVHVLWILTLLLCNASIAMEKDLVQVTLGCELKCGSLRGVQKMVEHKKYWDEPITIQGRWKDNIFVVSDTTHLDAQYFCRIARKYVASMQFGDFLKMEDRDFDDFNDCKTRPMAYVALGWLFSYEIQSEIELHHEL